jgi:hypothetical protein
LTVIGLAVLLLLPISARAEDRLCDPGAESCRDILINYIRNEQAAIDVGFWFMEDARYTNELINRFRAGVPIRVMIDTRASAKYPLNAERIKELADAGIPIRRASSGYNLHWKMMLFSGQNVVQFSGANYSADAWRPTTETPYENYTDEVIYFTDNAAIVNSFRTRYDDLWTNTGRFANYANVTSITRSYDQFPKDPELNFPPQESYRTRAVGRYNAEDTAIDVIMYRVADKPHADAMIAAVQRGVPVRLITEPETYRDINQMWHSWNIDRMYMAGVRIKHRAHLGQNHQKSVLLHEQRMAIFGSSNWTPWDESQYQHNLFTTQPHIYNWLVDQFERKWNNTGGVVENVDFVPQPPDPAKTPSPADATVDVGTSVTLSWYGGPWAHKYDVYLGTTTSPARIAQDLTLGPSETSTERQQYAIPTTLTEGTTYYWRVVAKTMADREASSPLWSFTTAGIAPPPPPPEESGALGAGDILLYASKATRAGSWVNLADGSAAGAVAIRNPDAGAAKVSSAQANPASYFELAFNATAGIPYRLWIRARAENDHWSNDSLFIQFSGSVNSSGSPQWRIGTTSSTELNLEDCSGCGLSGWGWQDNGWGVGVLGPLVYFATTGPQTLRIHPREDGMIIDQIMLSPEKFITTAPGALKNDTTIYPESSATSPPPPSVTVVRQPYLQQVTSTSGVVAWTTIEPGPASVRLLRSGSPTRLIAATSQLFASTTTGLGFDYYQHVAHISGLNPLTTYEYDILVRDIDANPGTDTLRTAPGSPASSVRFVAFGDSGTGSTAQQQLSARMKADTFDFALHGGDMAYGVSSGTGPGTYRTLEDWFFNIYKDWLRSRPMFPSMGNHDSNSSNDNGRPYRDAFVLPEEGGDTGYPDHAERYYSFDYGPVHVVVLDTELAFQDLARRDAQLTWLNEDLSTTARPWKIAVFHRSPYSAGGEHGSDLAVRAAFGPVFEQHNVQLVLSAHEHTYERTKPINDVTYVVTGGGGAPLYAAGTASFTAASASRHHYVRGDVNECTLKLDAVGTDGSVFDTVTLSRCTVSDTTPPTATITSPSDGATVSGTVTVTASASDDVGVVRAELFVDGLKALEDTSAPFGFSWSSTSVSNGSHTLEVRATDAAGNVGSSGTIVVQVNNGASASGEIVLYAASATVVQGGWSREADSAAAGGAKLRHPNAGAARIDPALANPVHYFEMTIEVQSGVPYHLWIRGKAQGDGWKNDSVYVQFSSGTSYTSGTTSALEVNLEDCSGCGLSGWGWQDNGYGAGVLGPHITFSSGGTKTIRVQTREDGLAIDQIVLSPSTYLTSSPGALKDDTTIVPLPDSGPPPADTENPAATMTSPGDGATVTGTVDVAVNATDDVGVTKVDLLVNGTAAASDTSAPFGFSWNTSGLSEGAYTLQARAHDAAGKTGLSTVVTVQVEHSTTPPPGGDIVLYAADVVKLSGTWVLDAQSDAAGGFAVRNPNDGAARVDTALASPTNYVEFTVNVQADVPYHLWIRGRAQGNGWKNDSVHVQFSGTTAYGIGTTSATEVNLEDCGGCGLSGWGWQDNGYGAGVLGPNITFTTSGPQTIRIQTREDGMFIDQIVLSPSRYLTTAPGALKDDTTIVQK